MRAHNNRKRTNGRNYKFMTKSDSKTKEIKVIRVVIESKIQQHMNASKFNKMLAKF